MNRKDFIQYGNTSRSFSLHGYGKNRLFWGKNSYEPYRGGEWIAEKNYSQKLSLTNSYSINENACSCL